MRDVGRETMPLRSAGFAILVSLVCATLGSAASGGPAADEARRADYARPASVPYPESNPFSQEKADLGRALFFEPRLSAAGTMACATCHKPERAWSDGLAPSQSSQTALMSLHPPSLLDIAWLDRLGWEGRYRDIEAVTFVPILSTTKMNMTEQKLIAFLSADPAYAAMFASAFPGEPIGRRPIEMALATFERSITSGTAPFDRWIAGDGSALSSAGQTRLRALFRQGPLQRMPQRLVVHRRLVSRYRCRPQRRSRPWRLVSLFAATPACVQDADVARCRQARVLHARWFARIPQRGDRSL